MVGGTGHQPRGPGPVLQPQGAFWGRQALAHVEEILEHLDAGGTLDGTIAPFQVYLTCYRVLEANQDPRAPALLDAAHERLQERAAKIGDETMQRSFLEDVAAHRQLVQAFKTEEG